MRMSRAGRKELMLKAICRHDKRHPRGSLQTAKVAHAAGLMSSTEVVKMLRELAEDGLIIETYIEPSYQCGYTIRAWQLARHETMPLPSKFITINGVMFNRNTGEELGHVEI